MNWFNYYGLAIMAIIMIPNIIYAIKHKNKITKPYKNNAIIMAEQIGRYGCFIFMIFNIPYTYFNFWFENANIVYLAANGILCFSYCLLWIIYFDKHNKFKTFTLSIIPTTIFLLSGIIIASIPLIIFAIIFGMSHIYISYKNMEVI